jgi:predicted nucleic acid-binding protein
VAHEVPVIGSLGVVFRSKMKRHVDRARPLIDDLVDAGMFVDDEFIRRVLEDVAE